MYLTVRPPVARVMIAQWENECVSLSVLSVARVQFPAEVEYFKRFPWLIINTWSGDGPHQVLTSLFKRYEENRFCPQDVFKL